MNLDKDDMLTIGSVIRVKNINSLVMVIGYSMVNKDKKCYDYVGCFYPIGIPTTGEQVLFNKENIEEIVHNGYSDEEDLKFKEEHCKFIEERKKDHFLDQKKAD